MATRTTNYDLYKPDANDDFEDFRSEFNDNMEIIDQNLGGGGGSYTAGDGIDITSNVISVDTAFTEAGTRQNIASGDTLATILGKIKKFFTDLKTVAFSGSYNDLSDRPTIPTATSDLTNDSGFTATSWTQIQQSGTKIASINIDGNTTDVYAPAGGGTTVSLIPTMNSNSQDGYIARASSEWSSDYQAYMAFDGTTTHVWAPLNITADHWVEIEMPSAKKATKFTITTRKGSYYATSVTVQGSNDGVNYDNLGSASGMTPGASATVFNTSTTNYSIYRFVIDNYGLAEIAIEGESGGGGYETIEDADGTALTQRDTVQFGGYLKSSDDNVNQKTVVSDEPTEITWSAWQNLTTAQKEGTKWLIKDVPSAEGSVEADLLTLLWENPSPSSAFAPQNITLSSADYDMTLTVFAMASSTSIYQLSSITEKGKNIVLTYPLGTSANKPLYTRYIFPNSDTVFGVGTGYENGTANTSCCIPIKIYGIKKKITVSFDALAESVSTLASKCILSDGLTSVEDALNEPSVSGTIAKGTGVSAVPSLLKKNGVAYISGAFEVSSSTIAVNQVLGILPADYRPTSTRMTPSYPASVVVVNKNGNIYPVIPINNTSVWISISYPLV